MKGKRRDKTALAKTDAQATSVMSSSKTIVKEPGKEVRQYPAKVGYHGTDDEARLSPEE
jgi:hypothetical protein